MNTEERKMEFRKRTKEFAGYVVDLFINLDRRRDEVAILGKQLIFAVIIAVCIQAHPTAVRNNSMVVLWNAT